MAAMTTRASMFVPLAPLFVALLSSCGDGDPMPSSGEGDGSGGSGSGPMTDAGTGPVADSTAGSTDDPSGDPTGDPTGGVTTTPDPVCGNGIVEGIEQCDDDNDVPADGCEIDCTTTYDTSIWEVTAAGAAGIRDAGNGIAVDGTGAPIVVGYVVDEVGDPDIWIRRYDPAGEEVWTTVLDPSMGGEDRAWAVAVDGDDNILVAGETDTAPAVADVWIGKLDSAGSLVWSDTVDGPDMDNDGARGVAVDASGTVAVTGYLRVGNGDNDIYVGTWSSDGTPGWSEVVPGPDVLDDRGTGIAFDGVGDLVVCGFISHAGFNRDVWVRKYDIAGAEQWTFEWDGDESGDDAGFAIAIAPDDTIGVTGMSPIIATNQDVWLGKIDPEGALVWWKRFGAPSVLHDNGLGLTSNAEGDFVIAGFKSLSATDTDIWLRKYDAGGNVIWTQARGGAGMGADEARAIAADAAGDLYVTGEIRADGSNNGEIWVGKFGP